MSTIKEKFDSAGGFSVDKTVVIDELNNVKDINSLEIKNQNYSDSKVTNYILRGLNTSVLELDNTGTQIPIDNDTINFITGHIIGVNANGLAYSLKIESVLLSDNSGQTSVLSSMTTIIKDSIPEGQTWEVSPLGSQNLFSYNTVRAGTTNNIKWIASTQIISIAWQ